MEWDGNISSICRGQLNKMKVVITGSSRGIGQAVSQKFLKCGHEVTGLDILPASISHKNYRHVICDISADEFPDLGAVDILINNAGVQNGADIDVNLKGTIRVTEKYGLQRGIKSVLFIASASATTGSEFPEYAASKGGVVSYMKNVALRIAGWGATANSLSPGGVLTESNSRVTDNAKLWAQIMELTPLKKWATVQEIAEWAYFVTAVNKSMTAQDIIIDNGESSRAVFVW